MSMDISSNYYKTTQETYMCTYIIISPPSNIPELSGYIMKINKELIIINNNKNLIHIDHGNEWDKTYKHYVYMFEKEEKIKGHPSKRYRYSEDELFTMYGCDKSNSFVERFNKREKTFKSGSGSLIRCKYTDFNKRGGLNSKITWLIAPDSDKKWAYEFNYDPLRDMGKHNKDGKGFELLESYHINNISILSENKQILCDLLYKIDSIRELKLNSNDLACYYDRSGKPIYAASAAESIAYTMYEMLPRKLTIDKYYGHLHGTSFGEEIVKKLVEVGKEMENLCQDAIAKYKKENIHDIALEIKKITGIVIEE